MVELLHRLDQAQVALLDQVEELHPPAHIPLGNAHHQAQVGLSQTLFGGGVALGHALGQLDFLLAGEQRHPADLLQIDLHRVVDVDAVHKGEVQRVIIVVAVHIQVVDVVVQGGALLDDLDVLPFQHAVELVHLLHIVVELFQGIGDVLGGEFSLRFAGLQQVGDHIFLIVFGRCHAEPLLYPLFFSESFLI